MSHMVLHLILHMVVLHLIEEVDPNLRNNVLTVASLATPLTFATGSTDFQLVSSSRFLPIRISELILQKLIMMQPRMLSRFRMSPKRLGLV